MPISLSTAEFWDLKKPEVPTRSRLFHLQPIGIGHLFVESLMGYVVRLADYHCVTPRQLMFKEVAPRMLQKGYPSLGWQRKIEQIFMSHSPLIKGNELRGQMATALIQSLEELTLRHDLSQLTLLRQVTALFGGSQLRNHQAWCPLCLEEWREARRTIYTPLIWLLKDLMICPQHRFQALIGLCPHCQESFPPLSATLSLGFCPKCHRWLGNLTVNQSHLQPNHENSEWGALIRNPLEAQLFWLDDVDKLLDEAKQPFYPPRLPG
jgi:TniQ